jgi:hypothetical protein
VTPVSHRLERIAYLVGGALLAGGLAHVLILLTTGGSWDGPASLRKAATFGLSFGTTLLTIAWVSSCVPLTVRARSWLLGIFTVACVLETLLVSLQAWRGVPSHFNMETPFDAWVARLLAFGGLTIVVTIGAFTTASFRTDPQVPASLRVAIRAGFVALCAAQFTGALMIAKGMVLVFGGDPQAAYATGGWLRPLHGFTMHGILVLPLMERALSFARWDERRRLSVIWIASLVYFVGVVVVASSASAQASRKTSSGGEFKMYWTAISSTSGYSVRRICSAAAAAS